MAVVNIRDSFVDVPMFSYLFYFLKEFPPAGRGIARSNHLFISFSLFLFFFWVGWLLLLLLRDCFISRTRDKNLYRLEMDETSKVVFLELVRGCGDPGTRLNFFDDDDLYACVYKEKKKQNSPFQMFIDAPS